MKRTVSIFMLLLIALSVTCSGAWYYPAHDGKPAAEPVITERINIVFDNSGHDKVKDELKSIFLTAVIAEHSEVWIYPIAGSNPSVKVEPSREFAEANFIKYSKASNEFKQENVFETAINDLYASPYSSKRLIFMAELDTGNKNSLYDSINFFRNIVPAHPDIKFSYSYCGRSMMSNYYTADDYPNLDTMDGSYMEYILTRNGYAKCESTYDRELGYAKIGAGKANKNLFVYTDDSGQRTRINDEYVKGLYLSGCVMGESNYSSYLSKNKVKGVAVSYNHVVAENEDDDGSTFAAALYTLDGEAVNPDTEAIIIPVLNAKDVEIYHKETPQSGKCSKNISYDASYDKKIPNLYKEEDDDVSHSFVSKELKEKDTHSISETNTSDGKGFNILTLLGNILIWILGIIVGLLSFVVSMIPLALIIFFALYFLNEKFQSNVKLKFRESKIKPWFEKFENFVDKTRKDYFGGVKVRGTKNPKGRFIFVCKKTEDMENGNSRASKIVRELQRRGIECWLSEDGIDIGEDHNVIIPRKIRECSLFLVFISTRSVNSQEVITEFKSAKDANKRILPVQIENFDLFKKYENWKFMLQPYQMHTVFSSKDDAVMNIADKIEKQFKDLDK